MEVDNVSSNKKQKVDQNQDDDDVVIISREVALIHQEQEGSNHDVNNLV